MEKTITIPVKDLKKLVENFFEVCSVCDELDIYEHESMDKHVQKMEEWVDKNFGRDLENMKLS